MVVLRCHQALAFVTRALSLIILVTVVSALNALPASAQQQLPVVDWEKRQNADQRLTAFGDDMFGDGIDPHTGSISFFHTDVSLPGNSGLEVAISRKRVQGVLPIGVEPSPSFGSVEFADWELIVPRIKVTTANTPNGQHPWTGARCSTPYQNQFPPVVWNGDTISKDEYSNGITVDVGGSSEQLLGYVTGGQWPVGATHVTKANWYFTCGSASDGGQGFIGHAPNGATYRFDRVIIRENNPLDSIGNQDLPRRIYIIAATEVTDVNGNWVRYYYDAGGRLTKIDSNDGREITLSYYPSASVVQTVTANGRVWTYGYGGLNYDYPLWKYNTPTPAPGEVLSVVTLPDGRQWTFDLSGMAASTAPDPACFEFKTIAVTHPSGAEAEFELSMLGHRYWYDKQTAKPPNCPYFYGADDNPFPVFPTRPDATTQVMSVVKKTVSGASIPTAVWEYEYEQDLTTATSINDRTNWTRATGPGVHITYYHTWMTEPEGGALVKKEVRQTAGGAVLETTEYQYFTEGVIGDVSHAALIGAMQGDLRRSRRTTEVKTTRGADWWRTANSYDTSFASATYGFGAPHTVAKDSNVSTTAKTTVSSFVHKKPVWVLNLPDVISVNGREISRYYYDALGRKTAEDYRQLHYADYAYHTDGTLNWVRDAINRTTYALNWKRGSPQQITRADATSTYQSIDNNGWLMSSTDASGFVTTYQRDNMGRLTTYTPTGWTPTTLSYSFNALGAVQTITKGASQSTITYDNFWRPRLIRTQETATGWSAYVNTTYDAHGRTTFASYPSTSATETSGITTTYDTFGRPLTTAAPGATTTYQYLDGHIRRVVDPVGNQTDNYFTGYEGPDSKEIVRIAHPLGVNTWINRNIWGEIGSVQQGDATTSFIQNHYYDAQGQRCRYVSPEGGHTLFGYNAARELISYEKGAASGTTCVAPGGTSKVTLAYDLVGRSITTDYTHASTPDVTRAYDTRGNLISLTRGASVWTYQYNALSLLTQEKLVIDGRTYQTDYGYNLAGNLTQTTYPNTAVIEYDPDGLGRARKAQVAGGGASFASNLSYLSNGALGSFTYGNGFVFTQTLNARRMPRQVTSVLGGTRAVDLIFDYYANDQISAITDNADPAINPGWYSQIYTYDAVGNLRQQQIGTRLIETQYDASTNRLMQAHDNAAGPNWKSYAYDARGNVTQDGALNMSHDYSDQPTSLSGSATATYAYDGNFKRAKQVSGGATIYSVYGKSGKLLLRDNVTTGTSTRYIDVAGRTVAELSSGPGGIDGKYYHTDHLGSPLAATNAAGAILWREQYSPFGQAMQADASHSDNIGFTGHVEDASGLTYMQARYYDPVVGRFLGVDPAEFAPDRPAMFNRYAYVGNDPVNRTDPTGECIEDFCIGEFLLLMSACADSGFCELLAARAAQGLGWAAFGATTGMFGAEAVIAAMARADRFVGASGTRLASATTANFGAVKKFAANADDYIQITGPNKVITLGSDPAYRRLGDSIGGIYVNIPDEVYKEMGEGPARLFIGAVLAKAAEQGYVFRFATKIDDLPKGSTAEWESIFLKELGLQQSGLDGYAVVRVR